MASTLYQMWILLCWKWNPPKSRKKNYKKIKVKKHLCDELVVCKGLSNVLFFKKIWNKQFLNLQNDFPILENRLAIMIDF